MKIPNKRELQQIAINHLSNIDFKDFKNLFEKYTVETYCFLNSVLWSDQGHFNLTNFHSYITHF